MRKPKFDPRFKEDDLNKISNALGEFETLCEGLLETMTPEERQRYGRVGNSTLEWDTRVRTHMQQRPDFAPSYLNKESFYQKLGLQQQVRPIINRLRAILENWEDTESLINYDVDNDAREYYQNVKTLTAKSIPGAQTIYNDLYSRMPTLVVRSRTIIIKKPQKGKVKKIHWKKEKRGNPTMGRLFFFAHTTTHLKGINHLGRAANPSANTPLFSQ